jgi:hypothetical protein
MILFRSVACVLMYVHYFDDWNFRDRTDFRCLGMRTCSVVVDVDALEAIVHQAIQAIRIKKYKYVHTVVSIGRLARKSSTTYYHIIEYLLIFPVLFHID